MPHSPVDIGPPRDVVEPAGDVLPPSETAEESATATAQQTETEAISVPSKRTQERKQQRAGAKARGTDAFIVSLPGTRPAQSSRGVDPGLRSSLTVRTSTSSVRLINALGIDNPAGSQGELVSTITRSIVKAPVSSF